MRNATDPATIVFPHGLSDAPRFEDLQSTSLAVCRALDAAMREVATSSSILICGEPGTGKAALAQAIHAAHRFPGRPFVRSFLGAARGATWFAERVKDAQRGTLFLQDPALAPQDVRHGMLVTLEQRLHEDLQVRIVTSSTRPRGEMEGNPSLIDPDLLRRLSDVVLELPPLRERSGDVVPLFEAILAREAARAGREPFDKPSRLARAALEAWSWPRNLHDLHAAARHVVAATKSASVGIDDLGLVHEEAVAVLRAGALCPETVEDQRLDLVIGALVQANGNVVDAAGALGVSKSTLYVWVRRLGVEPRMFRLRRRRA